MNKHLLCAMVLGELLFVVATARALGTDELASAPPMPCTTSTAKRSALPSEDPYYFAPDDVKFLDLDGNQWCDYVVSAVMNTRTGENTWPIYDLVLMGSKAGWLEVAPDKELYSKLIEKGIEEEYITGGNVGTSDIALVYQKNGGAPYILGLEYGNSWNTGGPGCYENMDVFQWDERYRTFKRVPKTEAQIVLQFARQKKISRC
jgi:hypothetical protein